MVVLKMKDGTEYPLKPGESTTRFTVRVNSIPEITGVLRSLVEENLESIEVLMDGVVVARGGDYIATANIPVSNNYPLNILITLVSKSLVDISSEKVQGLYDQINSLTGETANLRKTVSDLETENTALKEAGADPEAADKAAAYDYLVGGDSNG